jgi:hypothetical protein
MRKILHSSTIYQLRLELWVTDIICYLLVTICMLMWEVRNGENYMKNSSISVYTLNASVIKLRRM